MRILGLDTATAATAVALLDTDTGASLERRDDPPGGARPRHTARLLELVADALGAAGASWESVDRIAVGVGPGTFTGIRIGVASARALALARELPLVGVSTLHALALAAIGVETGADTDAGVTAPAGAGDPLAVLDARRREVFIAGWSAAAAGDPLAPPRLPAIAIAPAELPARLAAAAAPGAAGWLAVGDGARLAGEALREAGVRLAPEGSPLHRVSATAICRLAAGRPAAAPGTVRPEYLRAPDAVPAPRPELVR